MSVPPLDELHRPVLEIAASAEQRLTRQHFVQRLSELFSLTEHDLQEMVPSGVQTRIENRANWAITDLKKAGLMDNPERNQWEITKSGRDYLATHSGIIKIGELEKLWPESTESSDAVVPSVSDTADITPDEQIAQSYQQQRDQLIHEVLDSLKGVSPSSFERLVVGLLAAMGYGDGRVVGRPGDQGIDGILDQDALGLEKVYVQAKRYTAGQVGEPEIRNFSGSLLAQGATKGVLITTTAFSPTAFQTAQSISMGNQLIRLIDGRELAELMINHSVGVVTEITYEIKKLDANYFADL